MRERREIEIDADVYRDIAWCLTRARCKLDVQRQGRRLASLIEAEIVAALEREESPSS